MCDFVFLLASPKEGPQNCSNEWRNASGQKTVSCSKASPWTSTTLHNDMFSTLAPGNTPLPSWDPSSCLTSKRRPKTIRKIWEKHLQMSSVAPRALLGKRTFFEMGGRTCKVQPWQGSFRQSGHGTTNVFAVQPVASSCWAKICLRRATFLNLDPLD